MSIFSENLEKARKKANFSRKEMAQKLNLSLTSYANYEYGEREPKLKTLVEISKILNVSIDDLLGNKQDDLNINFVISQLLQADFIVKPLENGSFDIVIERTTIENKKPIQKTYTFNLNKHDLIENYKIAFEIFTISKTYHEYLKDTLQWFFVDMTEKFTFKFENEELQEK